MTSSVVFRVPHYPKDLEHIKRATEMIKEPMAVIKRGLCSLWSTAPGGDPRHKHKEGGVRHTPLAPLGAQARARQ